MSKTILITGSRGLVGSHLVRYFASEPRHESLALSPEQDITDYDTLTNIGDFDTLIHCAASFEGDSPESLVANERVNSVGALNMCRLAKNRDCRHFVYISSIFTYNNRFNEYFNSYGLSKRHGEENISFFCKHNNMDYSILNFSQIYDAQRKAEKHQRILYFFIDTVLAGDNVTLFGKNNPKRNFIFIDDVVEIITRVVNGRVCGKYDCVHPESHTIRDIISVISDAAARDITVTQRKDKPSIRRIYIPSDMTLYDKIDYYPRVSLASGVRQIIKNTT